jgi:predicted DNA-binding transcriptional regulator AlpA
LKDLTRTLPAGAPAAPAAAPDPATPIDSRWIFTEAEAAKLLRLSRRTLQRLRIDGGGPIYVKLTASRIGYAFGDLEAWVHQRRAANTSAATVAAEQGASAPGGAA